MSNAFLNSERPLHSLTKKEFDELKKSGMLWELYPEAPEYWSSTKGKSVFLANLHYFFAQTDGTYKYPDGVIGDLLKQAKKEIEE